MNLSQPIALNAFPSALDPEDTTLIDIVMRLAESKSLGLKLETDADLIKLHESLLRFGPQDFEAALRIKWLAQLRQSSSRDSANECSWLQVDNDYFEDSYLAFYGLQAGLTWLLGASLQYGAYPSLVEISASRVWLVFPDHWEWRAGVELRRAQPTSPPTFAEHARYISLLSGLAGTERPNEVLVQRMQALPGWGNIKLRPTDCSQDRPGHAPLLKEWRRLATAILRGHGLGAPTAAQIEEVVCTVLGYPGWNHLAAAYKAAAESTEGLLLYRTAYISNEKVSFEQIHGTLEAALHSLVTAVQGTARYAAGWGELQVDCNLSDGSMEISATNAPEGGTWRLNWSFGVSPNRTPPPLQDWVRSFFDGRVLDEGTLRELFLMNLEGADRSNRADRLMMAKPLAQVGARRLDARPPYYRHEGHLLTVHDFDDTGTRKPGYGVFFCSDRCCLLLDKASGYFVVAEQRGDEFCPCTVFTSREEKLAEAVSSTVQAVIQEKGEAFFAVMTAAQRIRWKAEIRKCVERTYPKRLKGSERRRS